MRLDLKGKIIRVKVYLNDSRADKVQVLDTYGLIY